MMTTNQANAILEAQARSAELHEKERLLEHAKATVLALIEGARDANDTRSDADFIKDTVAALEELHRAIAPEDYVD